MFEFQKSTVIYHIVCMCVNTYNAKLEGGPILFLQWWMILH